MSKLNVLKVTLLLYVNIVFMQCSSRHHFVNIKNTETLDISEIQKKIKTYTKIHKQELFEKCFLEFKEGNLLINISNCDTGIINYSERNTETGAYFKIRGDKKNGFIKQFTNNQKDKVYGIKEYYGDGKIKSLAKIYSEGELGHDYKKVEFPTEKYYKYDENGNLIVIIDYNKIFKFSYNDLIKLFADKGYSFTQVKGYNYPDGVAKWEIWYRDTKKQLCIMTVNPKTGRIISDHHGITFVE